MKRICLLICSFVFVISNSIAQTNIEKSLESIRKNGNLVKSIKYTPEDNNDYAMEESAIYYIKNNEEQINDFLQAIRKDNRTASMHLQSNKKGALTSETLIFRANSKQIIYTIEMVDSANAEISYIKSKFVMEKDNNYQSANNTNKVKYLIPKGSYITIDGEKMNAEKARALGLDIEEQ